MAGGEKSGTAGPQLQTQLKVPLQVHRAGTEGESPPQGLILPQLLQLVQRPKHHLEQSWPRWRVWEFFYMTER